MFPDSSLSDYSPPVTSFVLSDYDMMDCNRGIMDVILGYNPLEYEFFCGNSIADIPIEVLVPVPQTPAGLVDPNFHLDLFSPFSPSFLNFEAGTLDIFASGNAYGGYAAFTQEDQRHDRAEDALKARFTIQANLVGPNQLTFEGGGATMTEGQCLEPVKLIGLDHAEVVVKSDVESASIDNNISAFRRSRPLKTPTKRRAQFTMPQTAYHAPSPSSSVSQYSDNDDDFFPSSLRPTKRQKRSLCAGGRKTQLQMVLDDLPFTMDDILIANGFYHCPFSGCGQTTTSEGDLGRHLESSMHATHNYVCLASNCLDRFARHDSMKRHHQNNRGRPHKVEHDRAIKMGFKCRVRLSEFDTLKNRLMAATDKRF